MDGCRTTLLKDRCFDYSSLIFNKLQVDRFAVTSPLKSKMNSRLEVTPCQKGSNFREKSRQALFCKQQVQMMESPAPSNKLDVYLHDGEADVDYFFLRRELGTFGLHFAIDLAYRAQGCLGGTFVKPLHITLKIAVPVQARFTGRGHPRRKPESLSSPRGGDESERTARREAAV